MILLLIVVAGCRQEAAPAPATVETVPGTIVTVRTTTDDGRTLQHQILAADGVSRSMHELDRWLLLDFTRDQVIVVDQVAGSWTSSTLAELRDRKESLARGSVPASFPDAEVRRSGRSQRIAGLMADEYVITAGGFRRELWLSREPILDPDYLRLRLGAEQPGGSFPAALARLQLQLMDLDGFPLLDVVTLDVGEENWGSRREVVSIQQAPVATSRLRIPDGFQEASAKEQSPPARPTFLPAAPR